MSGSALAGRLFAIGIFTLAAAGARAAGTAPFPMLGSMMSLQVSSAQTHGVSSTLAVDVAPGHEPPMHVHTREDETYVVTRGHFRFYRGNQTFEGGPGSVVFFPRNVPHTFKVIGAAPGRLVFTLVPPGLENMFSTISKRGLTLPKDARAIVALGKTYGITYLLPRRPARTATR